MCAYHEPSLLPLALKAISQTLELEILRMQEEGVEPAEDQAHAVGREKLGSGSSRDPQSHKGWQQQLLLQQKTLQLSLE